MTDLDKDIDTITAITTRWMINFAPTPHEPIAVVANIIRDALADLNEMREHVRRMPAGRLRRIYSPQEDVRDEYEALERRKT